MTRFGWALVAVFILVAIGFASLVRFEPAPQTKPEPSHEASGGALVMPVMGFDREALVDTFGQTREGGERGHEALDMLAPRGSTVVAAASGTIEKLFESDRGGLTLYIRSPDRRLTYYYAHLDGYRPGLAESMRIRAGEPIGAVGSSGNADPAAPHLHFAIWAMDAAAPWYKQGRPINPYPLLARSGGSG